MVSHAGGWDACPESDFSLDTLTSIKLSMLLQATEQTKIQTISILGPTASGKTALAVGLARQLDGEVVSCDSMQIYKGMDIGTATPTAAERGGIPHHLLDICDPGVPFSAADYATHAAPVIADISSRGKAVILCGGTGLYLDALMKISGFREEKGDPALRETLMDYAREQGNDALHEELRKIDPEAAEKIHPNNVKRVIRAIEIYRTTGIPKTALDAMQTAGESTYDNVNVILEFRNRAALYERIDRRVDEMIASGLLYEAKALFDSGKLTGQTASQAIGYKEWIPYFEGKITRDEAAAQIKQSTRRYAKRQITWFRRYDGIRLTVEDGISPLDAAEKIRAFRALGRTDE